MRPGPRITRRASPNEAEAVQGLSIAFNQRCPSALNGPVLLAVGEPNGREPLEQDLLRYGSGKARPIGGGDGFDGFDHRRAGAIERRRASLGPPYGRRSKGKRAQSPRMRSRSSSACDFAATLGGEDFK
jgi:hypothetical protein